LNFISKRIGKNRTLFIAILLMAAAQLSKIVCYNPDLPYLALIPTVLLSAGMLMFYTLGASMVGDVCDEDELRTGTRSDGSYYSVLWWWIKMGNAMASFGMGVLLMYTGFDGKQNTAADALRGNIETISSEAEEWKLKDVDTSQRMVALHKQIDSGVSNTDKLRDHFESRGKPMSEESEAIRIALEALRDRSSILTANQDQLIREANSILELTVPLKQQTPSTLYRLRLFEIGLPLVLCIFTMMLAVGYPLTEERCYEIKAALEQRRAQLVS
jgi:GPH family glycoside/pentoside/hexuronide:cation symporter